jgi:hypothetical protein
MFSLHLFVLGFISNLPQLAWDKRLCFFCCCCYLLFVGWKLFHLRPTCWWMCYFIQFGFFHEKIAAIIHPIFWFGSLSRQERKLQAMLHLAFLSVCLLVAQLRRLEPDPSQTNRDRVCSVPSFARNQSVPCFPGTNRFGLAKCAVLITTTTPAPR